VVQHQVSDERLANKPLIEPYGLQIYLSRVSACILKEKPDQLIDSS
jgi:hypothetical protein